MTSMGRVGAMRSRAAPLIAWTVTVVVVAGGGSLLVIGGVRSGHSWGSLVRLSLLVLPLCGALLVNQKPANCLGWVFVVSGTAQVLSSTVVDGRVEAFGAGAGSPMLAWAADTCWPLGFPLLFAVGVLLFPDGLPSRRWRPIAAMAAAGVLAALVGAGLAPWPAELYGGLEHPFAAGDRLPAVFLAYVVGQLLLLVAACGGIAAGIVRYRTGTSLVRSQLRALLVFGVGAVAVVVVLRVVGLFARIPHAVEESAPAIVVIGFPVAVTVALFRHRLFDLDVVVNRAAVALVTTLVLGAGYAAVVGGLSWSLSSWAGWSPAFLGAVAVVLAFQPLVRRVRSAVHRRLFGEACDRYRVLTTFGEHADGRADVEDLADDLAQAAIQAVRAPHAAVVLTDGFTIEAGRPRNLPVERVALVSRGHKIGELVVCARSATDLFTAQERELLGHLARQTAAGIRLARQAEDVLRGQEVTTARVLAERQRLRRDLHDQLGPRLAGVSYLLHALAPALPAEDASLLERANAELQDAIVDVRRMAHDLRPGILEEVGLAEAIRRHAAQISLGSPLSIAVEADELPDLPEKVETALYRVALEALSNVGRHANAQGCLVRLSVVGEHASLEITDDGKGITDDHGAGIGLASMSQRAAELGGTCEITGHAGTTVRAMVPVHA